MTTSDSSPPLRRRRQRCCEKLIYVARHAQALHNVKEQEAVSQAKRWTQSQQLLEQARKSVLDDPSLRDAPLSPPGHHQIQRQQSLLTLLNEQDGQSYPRPEIVLVSPLRRALETATELFHLVPQQQQPSDDGSTTTTTTTTSSSSMDKDDEHEEDNDDEGSDEGDWCNNDAPLLATSILQLLQAVDCTGNTPLHYACSNGHVKILRAMAVAVLLGGKEESLESSSPKQYRQFIDPEGWRQLLAMKNHNGRTPLNWAKANRKSQIVAELQAWTLPPPTPI